MWPGWNKEATHAPALTPAFGHYRPHTLALRFVLMASAGSSPSLPPDPDQNSGLVYSTFLGGSNYDWSNGIAVDAAGSAYVTGATSSTDFPTTPGAFDLTYNGGSDVFVTKLNVGGSGLVYFTFLGGSNSECFFGNCAIAVDSNGAVYVVGVTSSSNFPITWGRLIPALMVWEISM
ncbi:MAG: hypothetical protein C4309_12920 [Chloroflexota bacterium]